MDVDKIRQLVKVCKMYYLNNKSQNEIAQELYISRSQVSKLLTKAKQNNVVSFQINDPFSNERKVENSLKVRYHLKNAVVVDTTGYNDQVATEVLAKNISETVTFYASNESKIGISAGYTIASCSVYTNIYNCKNLKFIPLLGGQSFEGRKWYANMNCQSFATRLYSEYMILNMPMIVRKNETRIELSNNEEIKPILDCYNELDIILLGIGQTTSKSTLAKCSISREEIIWAYEHGVKAIIGASFIDAGGNEMLIRQNDIFMGIKAPDIKKCKHVIAVARGKDKIEAIKATLKGEYIHTLCTDLDTANELLK